MAAQIHDHRAGLARALLGLPIYIALESDGAPQTIPNALGVSGLTLDLHFADWFRERGEWRGRRPCIYLADSEIAKLAAKQVGGGEAAAAQLEREISAAVVIHECAHVAEAGVDQSEPTIEKQNFAHAVTAYSIAIAGSELLPPCFGHSARFVRLALHVAYRASRLGYSFPLDWLYNAEALGIAQPSEFLYSLADEPKYLARVPIFEVSTFRAPLHFRRLWNCCVSAWIEQQPADSPGVVEARAMLLSEQ